MQERADWRVSTYSTGTGNCVEVGKAQSAVVVRDTKNRAAGSLRLPSAAWLDFIESLNR